MIGTRLLAPSVFVAIHLVTPLFAQEQFSELLPMSVTPDTDGHPDGVIREFGDVDADGDIDLVGSDLYLNDGTGVFRDAAIGLASGSTLNGAALADVDLDGDLDLLTAGAVGHSQLFLNDGSGTFHDVSATHLPGHPGASASAVALGDLDGDGDPDAVLGMHGQNRLYINMGSGIFFDFTPTNLPVESATFHTPAIAFGDLDGDGDLDMVLGNDSPLGSRGPSRIYLNDGMARFADVTGTHMPSVIESTRDLALGDLDGDGDLDVVSASEHLTNRIYLNAGDGVFTEGVIPPAGFPPSIGFADWVDLGDVDRDGDLDILFGYDDPLTVTQRNRLFLNDGAANFTDATLTKLPAEGLATAVGFADVDGDQDLDIALTDPWQKRVWINDGSGRYVDPSAPRLLTRDGYSSVARLGDIDGDGDLDLLVRTSGEGRLDNLFRNDGHGRFVDITATHLPSPYAVWLVGAGVFGDVDGDGDLDLATTDLAGERLYLNDGSGAFSNASDTHLPNVVRTDSRSVDLAFGDVDRDGDLDLVVAAQGDSTYALPSRNWLYLNDGAGVFSDVSQGRMSAASEFSVSVELADLDGDGSLDIVVANRDSVRVHLNDGSGAFADTPTQKVSGTGWPFGEDSLAVGDVDGDGDPDVAVGTRRLLLNDGGGTLVDVTDARFVHPPPPVKGRAVEMGDLNGDGALDIVFAPGGTPGRLYLNDGSGYFTDVADDRLPDTGVESLSLALGDLDGDDDLDIVFSGAGGPDRVFFNLLRQLDAPSLLRIGGSYRLDVYARHGPTAQFDAAAVFLSTATASIPLPPFGVVGIDPNQMIALPAVTIPQPAGVASVDVPVPNAPALVGLGIFGQALHLPYPFAPRLTNVTRDVVIR